jgi:uncharacterized protein (DUF433 family)
MSKPADESAAVSSPRHVLPKDLANAIKYLGDEELDRLITAAFAEIRRRGRQLAGDKLTPEMARDLTQASLTRGELNAVRAAFKAGVTPARIARQFGLSQSDVRKALASKTFDQRESD